MSLNKNLLMHKKRKVRRNKIIIIIIKKIKKMLQIKMKMVFHL